MSVWSVCAFLSLWSAMANAKALADSPTFMMVSGISSSEEMCLTAANGMGREMALTLDAYVSHVCPDR